MHHPSLRLACASLLVLCAAWSLSAQEYRYDDAWGAAGLTLERSTATSAEVLVSVPAWSLDAVEAEGRTQSVPTLPGVTLPNAEGAPNLPGLARYIALPEGARARLTITGRRYETLHDVEIAPAPRIPFETEDGLDYARDAAIYGADAFYPAEVVQISDVRQVRGVDAVMLAVSPFQYNPVTRELRVYRDLRVEVSFEGGRGEFGEARLRSRNWDPLVRSLLLNGDRLPALTPPTVPQGRDTGFEYVIIAPDDPAFLAWADTLRTWRTEQGITTGVFTTAEIGGNTTAAIESFINTAYNTWDVPPDAVLLLGDYGSTGATIMAPMWNSYCVSDNIYADVDGDNLPDVVLARITARNAGELQTMIGKMLDYERQPPTSPSFYDRPVIAGGWQYERWFILCSEIVYGYMANELGKSPIREYAIYEGTPGGSWSSATNTSQVVSYFGPSGLGYIPATPLHLTDWGGSAARINADINAGTFIVQHRDHGAEDGWGEPYYVTSHLSSLHNEDLTFVFSINCLTGKYNWSSECFTERFHRHAQGALGLLAASEISYSFVNDAYIFGMYDYFWPDFDPGYGAPGPHDLKPAFGNAAGKYYLQACSWPYNTEHKVYTHHLFHHHGDAFMTVMSEVPQPLDVAHDTELLAGVGVFTVTADAGAQIGLSVGGVLIGRGVGTGLPVAIPVEPQLPGQDLVVTITRQNNLRYRAAVPVIPPSGPYLVFDGVAVIDADGDDDGALDYAEAAGLMLTLRNVGVEDAAGITATLTSEDPYLELAGEPLSFPLVPAGGSAMSLAPGAVTVAGDAPDGHVATVNVHVAGIAGAWDTGFTTTIQAPVLAITAIAVYDYPGGDGDGTAEAGESIRLVVSLTNVGHSACGDVAALLSSGDPNVVITAPASGCAPIAVGSTGAVTELGVDILATCPEPGYLALDLAVSDVAGFAADLACELSIGGWYDDLEADRGWTIGAADDDASIGLWVRADPVGSTYSGHVIQAEDDHTTAPGALCFVTGNGAPGGAAGDADVDGGKTTLLSPVFDLSQATAATVSYWRWYSNAWGNNPDLDYWNVDVTSDGVTWVSLEHTLTTAAAWTFMSFNLADHVALTDHVQVRFVAADEDGGSLVEAGIDDFLLAATTQDLTTAPETVAPARLALAPNHPNPFNPATRITFELPAAGHATLAVYDLAGRKIATLADESLTAGRHEITWLGRDDDGRQVASGIYVYRLAAAGEVLCRKMTLVK